MKKTGECGRGIMRVQTSSIPVFLWHICARVPKFFSDQHLITNEYSKLGCAYHGCKKRKVAMFDPLFTALRD